MLKVLFLALPLALGVADVALAVDTACGTRNPTVDAGFRELADKVANDLVKNPTRGAPQGKSWIDRYKKANKGSVPKILAMISFYDHKGMDYEKRHKVAAGIADPFETQFHAAMQRLGFAIADGYMQTVKELNGIGPRLFVKLSCGRVGGSESFRPLRLGAQVRFTGYGLLNRSSHDHLWSGDFDVEIKSAPPPTAAAPSKAWKRLHLGVGYGYNRADKNVYLAHGSLALFRRFEPELLLGAGERRSLTDLAPKELEAASLQASSALLALGVNVPLFQWFYLSTAIVSQQVTATMEPSQFDRLGRETKTTERERFSFTHIQGGLGLRLHLGPVYSQLGLAFLSHAPFRKDGASPLARFIAETYTPDRVMGSLSFGLAL